MEVGSIRIWLLYPEQNESFLVDRMRELWEQFEDERPEPEFATVDEIVRSGFNTHSDPVSVRIWPCEAGRPDDSRLEYPDCPRISVRADGDQQIRNQVKRDSGEEAQLIERYVGGLVDTIERIYRTLNEKPAIVYGITDNYIRNIGKGRFTHPVTEDGIRERRIEYIPWLIILSPPFIKTYGREELLSAPAWRIREFDDDAILLVAYSDLLYSQDMSRTSEVNEWLGLEDPGQNFPG
jgi:hypothetical protein